MEKQKKLNVILGSILVALSALYIVSTMVVPLQVIAKPVLIIGLCVSAITAVLTIPQVYHYQSCDSFNAGWFWFLYTCIGGVLWVVSWYLNGFNILYKILATSIQMGFVPSIIPVIGVFIGDFCRAFKGETMTVG